MIWESEFKRQAMAENSLIAFLDKSLDRLKLKFACISTIHSIIQGYLGLYNPAGSAVILIIINCYMVFLIMQSRKLDAHLISSSLERRDDSLKQADLAAKYQL